jgi:hypothetical protein
MFTKKYKNLFKKYKEQSSEEAFSSYLINEDNGETWEAPYERLAKLARKEDWDFHNPKFKSERNNYPILANYLNYTFLRAHDLNLIVFIDNDDKSCFNTGLQTENEKDIFALFFRNKEASKYNAPYWTLFGFVDSYSDRLKPFGSPLPGFPTYIDDPYDLVLNTKFEIEINTEHIIIDNKERLPSKLRDDKKLSMSALEGAIKIMKSQVIRNYKVAIPFWNGNKIQLLLPLNLTDDYNDDLALVVDKDKDRNIYKATTIFPLDWAYMNARLVSGPYFNWLNP